MCWEERAPTTGTPHWHGVFILTTGLRWRCLQLKSWLIENLPEMPQPDVEVCKNKLAAVRYSSMSAKDDVWL